MRAVIQRVHSARVTVDDVVTGEIGLGLLVYLGVGRGDDENGLSYLLNKIIRLRIFENESGKMDKSVLDVKGSLLVISQFTLYGDLRRGLRPSFEEAMAPELAEPLYNTFVERARGYLPVRTGRFRADMRVSSVNDGPVTLWLDSAKGSASA